MEIRINGSYYRCKVPSICIKHRFGLRAVLVHDSSSPTHPQKTHEMASSPPQEIEPHNNSSGDSGKIVISAVDARGHFAVEDGGSYSIFAYCTGLEDGEQGISRTIDKIGKKTSRTNPCLEEGLGDDASPSLPKRKRVFKTRALNKYNTFVGLFRSTFANTSFPDSAAEWNHFSKMERTNSPVEDLIERIRQQGKYQLHKSEI